MRLGSLEFVKRSEEARPHSSPAPEAERDAPTSREALSAARAFSPR